MHREIYLDNSATTKPYDELIEYISEINRNYFGNPSSLHLKGIDSERKINIARNIIANNLGAASKQILFTSGGTESNNLAIRGYLEANQRKGNHIITSKIEHPSVLEIFKYLEGQGYKVDFINVDMKGRILPDELSAKMSNETSLVSIMAVNNETGATQPVEEISGIIKKFNPQAVFHVDAVQAFGKLPLNPMKLGIDMMSISSHKIHGPKGIGCIYIKNGIKIKPIIFGGGQESNLRSGTENVSGICGFGMAAEITCNNIQKNTRKVAQLKENFIDKIKSCTFNYNIISPEQSSPYIINIAFEGLKSEVLLHHLEEQEIFVSAGSACSSNKKTKSHVLQAQGLSSGIIDSAIRFSFSAFNTQDDINDTISALQAIVPRIQINRRTK